MSVQIPYRKQFIFYILLIIIFLAVVEGLVRLYETSFTECDFIGKDALEHIDLKTQREECYEMSYFLHTDIEGIRMSEPNQHFTTVNINSYGFRGPEITQDKPSDTIRIFALGGSTTFGSLTTSDFTTIPGFLQKKIDNEHSSTVEVINAGILGANSSLEKQLLMNYVEKFNPDIIIVYDGANNSTVDLVLEQDADDHITWAIVTYVYQFYRTPTFIYKNFVSEGLTLDIDEKMSEQLAQSWKDDWKEACSQKRDYKIIIFIQPTLSNKIFLSDDESRQLKLDPRNEQMKYNLEKIADISSELKGTCDGVFDLRSSFENITEPIFFDNAHVNDLGNKIIAEKMYENLLPYLPRV